MKPATHHRSQYLGGIRTKIVEMQYDDGDVQAGGKEKS